MATAAIIGVMAGLIVFGSVAIATITLCALINVWRKKIHG